MCNKMKTLFWGLWGVVPAAVLLAAAKCLLHGLDAVLAAAAPVVGLDAADTAQYGLIVHQLKEAEIHPPVALTVLLCYAFAVLTAWLLHKKCKFCVLWSVLLWVVLIPVLFVLTLWFTNVNTIAFGAVLKSAAALL